MELIPMTKRYALEVVTWRYPKPYGCYDMTTSDIEVLADPDHQFYALLDGDQLIGYRSFGPDGQVPGGDYDASALDTGGGLRPDLAGRGLGRTAISNGLDFGRKLFAPHAFRVTVAAFNARALRVVESLGFAETAHFNATTDGRPYRVLVRAESPHRQ